MGAGADEILDIVAKVFLAERLGAVVPVPTYAMYRVITEQRGAPGRRGAHGSARATGYALDLTAVRAAARERERRLAVLSPNNPTALPEPDGAIAGAARPVAADAAAAGREPPIVVVDEAYAEFAGRSLADLRFEPSEPRRRPDREQGLCARRAARRLRDRPSRARRAHEPVPAAGVGVERVVTVVTEALLDADPGRATTSRASRRSGSG